MKSILEITVHFKDGNKLSTPVHNYVECDNVLLLLLRENPAGLFPVVCIEWKNILEYEIKGGEEW